MTVEPQSPEARRNFRLTVLHGALLIGTNNSVASPDLVLTAFAAHITSNPLILGLISPLQSAMYSLPQVWTIGWLQRSRRALPLYNSAVLIRALSWLALIGVALFVGTPSILLLTLMAFVLLGGMAWGVSGLPFIEIVGKIVPARQRGLVFGWRGALGGVFAVIGAQVVIILTGPHAHFGFPTSYGLLFVFAGLAQVIGLLAFSLVAEPESDITTQHPRPSLNVFRTIWRADRSFRHFVRGRTLFELSSAANGLTIVYANQVLGVRLDMVGMYLLISSLLRPIFSIAAGRLSVRMGNRLPVAAGVGAQAIGWGLLLAAQPLGIRGHAAELFMIPIYSLVAVQKGLVFSNLMALALNVTPEDERPLYMGGLNTWIGMVAFTGILSGVIAKTIGYEALFLLTAIMALLSAWQFATLHEHFTDDQPVPEAASHTARPSKAESA